MTGDPQGWVSIVQALGFPIVVSGYFMARDWYWTKRQVEANEHVAKNLAIVARALDVEESTS